MKKYLNRQIKLREKNLKYDFLPSMIEIIERPSNKLGTVILFLILSMIIFTIFWAAMSKIDITVTGTGSAMPEGGVVALNSIGGGRILEICVKDGDYVEKGDILLKLDAKEQQLYLSECQYNLEVFKVQRKVYEIVYKSLISEEETENNTLETMDMKNYGEYAAIGDAIVLENEVFISKLNTLKDNEEKRITKQTQILSILQNMNTLDIKIKSAELSLEKAENDFDKYVIKAPIEGTITQMKLVHEGSLITAGDMVGYLIPKEKENIFTAYIADEDISQIEIGNSVGIKIAAYDDTEYEYMEGNVVSIGDVALTMENLGSVYLVEINIKDLPDNIKAGVEGNCNIIIGQRSVLDYFMEPFKDGLNDSLKER